MGVGNHKAVFCVSGYLSLITVRYICFLYSVSNILTAVAFVQVVPCIGPTVFSIQGNGSAFGSQGNTVGIQGDRDTVRPDAVLIVFVIPFLGDGHADFRRCVGIGDGVTVDALCVTFRSTVNGCRTVVVGYGVCDFIDRIRNIRAICFFVQAGEGILPFIPFV